jgi:transglutaminase-like putative cysteine protease
MAGLNLPMNRSAARRFGSAAFSAPRLVMSWEDWLTFIAAIVAFMSVAVAIQQADWDIGDMPPVPVTAFAALLIGMIAARVRAHAVFIHPVALAIGFCVVVLVVQDYADGVTLFDRIGDWRSRMVDWWDVVLAGDISNDNLPFVTLVHGVTFFASYLAAYAIYRWHNPWLAILPGGAVLLAVVGLQRDHPTGAVLFFTFGAILLIARLHLQGNQERWKRQGVEYPEFISLSAGQLTLSLAVILVLLAWLMPSGNQAKAIDGAWDALARPFSGHSDTFSRLFHGVDGNRGNRLHGFGDYLPIQGDVTLGTKQLYFVKAAAPGFIRGTSYNEYTGNGWRITDRDSEKNPGGELAVSSSLPHYQKRNATILEVEVRDGDRVILSQGMPLGTNVRSNIETPEGFTGDIEQLTSRRGFNTGDTYNSVGSESLATADDLRADSAPYPEWVQRNLQLPDELPDRVREEARRIVGGAPTVYDAVIAVQEYLRAMPYNLAVPAPPPGRDVVDFLLFDLRQGYFDYQATAMAVMLRSLGIPARVAVGYVLDPAESFETTFVVRKDDAYTWVEVFFPTYGWVTFNPTSDRPAAGLGGAIGEGPVQDPNFFEQIPNLSGVFAEEEPGGIAGGVGAALDEDPVVNPGTPWTLIWVLTGLAAFAVVMVVSGRSFWNWGLAGIDGTPRLWARVQRMAGWARLGAAPAETPREWSRRFGNAIDRPEEAARLTEAYEEDRYGRPDLQRVDPEVTATAYQRLRNTLLKATFARRLPGGRGGDHDEG